MTCSIGSTNDCESFLSTTRSGLSGTDDCIKLALQKANLLNAQLNNLIQKLLSDKSRWEAAQKELEDTIVQLKEQNANLVAKVSCIEEAYSAAIQTYSNQNLKPIFENMKPPVYKLTVQNDSLPTNTDSYDAILARTPSWEWKVLQLGAPQDNLIVKHSGRRNFDMPCGKGFILCDEKIFESDFETYDTEDGTVVECRANPIYGRVGKIYYKNGDVYHGVLIPSKQLFSKPDATLKSPEGV